MAPESGGVLLDLTRLVSRLGRGPHTGIDRVEYAYLQHFMQHQAPLFGLVRSRFGFVLLDRMGVAALAARIAGTVPVGRVDLLGRLGWWRNQPRARAEADVRRLGIARAARPGLLRMLRRHLPHGGSYFNVGHANLTEPVLRSIRRFGLRVVVLVHDTIPMDHPEYCRPDTIAGFRAKLRSVALLADLLVHSSADARARTEAQLARLGRVPPGVTAHLGVPLPLPDGSIAVEAPYFVTLGTIEPRKNHALLLDIWERLGAQAPVLYVLGARGWSNTEVFARLDALTAASRVREMPGLGDGAVATLLCGAQALLAPSHAEGFGLPALEAAALGTRVVSADLPVARELLGDIAVYLGATDSYSWLETILRMAATPKAALHPAQPFVPPTWADHFKVVLNSF